MTPLLLLLCAAVAGATYWMTGRVRAYAMAHAVLDVPNSRSSHSEATPRGGGLAIVIGTTGGLVAAWAAGALPMRLVVALAGGGAIVAAIGWLDDHAGHIAPAWRLLVHLGAAAWVLAWQGTPAPTAVWRWTLDGPVFLIVSALGIAWLINLTNFMDGIDGIASVQAISVAAGGTLVALAAGAGRDAAAAGAIFAAATAGFLGWNWAPARIFMGDVGSGFLGLVLAALTLAAGVTAPAALWSWLILNGVFIVDATLTLARRAARGERVHAAHRSHAYQHAAVRRGRHAPVVWATLAINVAWLLPIALVVASGRVDGATATVIAYAPLAVVAWRLGAGTHA